MLLVLIWLAWQYLFRGRDGGGGRADDAAPSRATQNLLVGDVNLGQEVTGVFESATAALNDVTDAASAEAALPRLTEINTNLDRLGGLVGQLPAEGKSALAALINGALPELEALIARVSEIPGVGAGDQAGRGCSGREAEGDGRLTRQLTGPGDPARAGAFADAYIRSALNVSQALRSPVASPSRNQCTRWAELPWVKASGMT